MSTGSSTPETSAPTNILADLEQYLDAYRSAIEAECNAGPDYADTDPDVDRSYERVNVLGTELRRRMGEHQRLAEPPHLSEPAEEPTREALYVKETWAQLLDALASLSTDDRCKILGCVHVQNAARRQKFLAGELFPVRDELRALKDASSPERIAQLESDRRALAMLASERPEVFNPQALTAAKALRDDILAGVPR